MIQHDGWFWPDDDVRGRPAITRDCDSAIRQLLTHVRDRDCIIQAGGNVGVYPVALADHFKSVITVEPDLRNFACLSANIAARDALKRVKSRWAAFADHRDGCSIVEVEPNNCGAHRIKAGGKVPTLKIDDLDLMACDAIWLDCEGSELLALWGAVETIDAFSPVICAEDKGLDRAFGFEPGALANWLGMRGYEQVDRIGRDKVFRRQS